MNKEENKEEKWKYCPYQRCYFCNKVLESKDYEQDLIVTKCVHCDRSFLE